MKLKLITLITALLGCVNILAAQTFTFKGNVVNERGEALIGANIAIFDGDDVLTGASTDVNGMFTIRLEKGFYKVRTSYIGYEMAYMDLNIDADSYQTIALKANSRELRELTVTSQKRVESVKDVPISISAVPEKMILDNNIETFANLADYVPGVQIQEQVVVLPSFVIRGLTSDDSNFNVENRVSVFQDGVSISKAISSYVEFFDADRVEVLKGPQGTLFGRSAQIGAIHLVTKRPTDRLSLDMQVGGGNYNQRYAQMALNVPIIPGKLLSRFSGVLNYRDGYVENIAPGQDDLMGKGTAAGRASFRYLAGKTVVDLIFNVQVDDSPGTAFKSGAYAPANGDTRFWTKANLSSINDKLGATRDVWGLTLDIKHDFSQEWSLSAITGYRSLNGREIFDSDGTAANALQFDYDADYSQFSQELRLNYNTERISAFGGLNYFIDQGDADLYSEFDERSVFNLLTPILAAQGIQVPVTPLTVNGEPNIVFTTNPLTGLPLKPEHAERSLYGSKNYAYDAFADITLHLTDKWDVTVGGRYTMEYLESYLENPIAESPGTLGFFLTGTPTAPQPNDIFALTMGNDGTLGGRFKDNRDFTAFVYRFNTDYEVNETLSLFASVGTGRRPYVLDIDAGLATNGTPQTTLNVLKDEDVISYEAGIKTSLFDNKLSLNASAFLYKFSNFQTSVNDLSEGELFETQDSGSATGKGFEVDGRWLVFPDFEIFGNLALLNSTFDDEDSDGNPQELAGNRFRLNPRGSGAIGFNLMHHFGGYGIALTPSYSWKTHHYFEDQNTIGLEQDAYALANINFSILFPYYNARLQIFANNLFDENYLIDAGNTGGSFGIPTFIAGPRRFVGAKLRFSL